jgi:hypothetical protein
MLRQQKRMDAFPVILTCAILAGACYARPAAAQSRTAPILPHFLHIADESGNPVSSLQGLPDPSTPLYDLNTDPVEPILAPDGRPITIGEWGGIDGEATLTRMPNGTELKMEMTGLVPGGVYTVWRAYFGGERFNYSQLAPNFPQNTGVGAIGAIDGSDSRLDADESGNATFSAMIPSGPLSVRGEAPAWALDGVSDFAVVAIYHKDGIPWGPVAGPNHVGCLFAGFNAIPEPSSVVLVLCAAVGGVGIVFIRRRVN